MLIFTFQIFGILICALLIKNILKLITEKNEKQYEFDSYMDNNTILTERFQELAVYLKNHNELLKSPQYDILLTQINEFIILLKKDFFWDKNPAYSHHQLLKSSRNLLEQYDLKSPLTDDILLDYEIEENLTEEILKK